MVSQEWIEMRAAQPKRHLNIVAPDGTKGRTGSQRRYVVCRSAQRMGSDAGHRKIILLRRTDNIGTARHEAEMRRWPISPSASAPFI